MDQFERLDDVIMGGISTSSLQNVPSTTYARWFGICRTDGGGFCGFRTLPFDEPLPVNDASYDGLYLSCHLASDDEPERRVWKMTTRVRPDRGEELYQGQFYVPTTTTNNSNADGGFGRVKIPFSSFRLVRGPRMVPDAPPLNLTATGGDGLYQIGLSLSKFKMGVNVTEMDNFRPGFFELQLREIGLYKEEGDLQLSLQKDSKDIGEDNKATEQQQEQLLLPKILSKEQALKRRPLLLKVLRPVGKLLFSEQSQRRKSAMKILRKQRGLSRWGAISFGLKSRANAAFKNAKSTSRGRRLFAAALVGSLAKTLYIVLVDSFRTLFFFALRITLVYPILLVTRTVRKVSSIARNIRKNNNNEDEDEKKGQETISTS